MTQEPLIILDVETTGLSPWHDRVIEIGAIKVDRGEVQQEFQALLRSVDIVPSFISRLTGITDEMLFEFGNDPEDLLPKFREFVGDYQVVGHNVGFDYNFLNAEFHRCSLPLMKNRKLCTCQLSRRKWPHLPNHKLTTVKEYLGSAGKIVVRRKEIALTGLWRMCMCVWRYCGSN
jgi:DNA polymerase-3 subunit epsilon